MRSLRLVSGMGVAMLALVGASVGAACGGNAFSSGGPGDGGGTNDGPGGDGPGGEAGGDAPSDVAIDALPPAGKTIFVSNVTGDDSRDGTEPTRPVKTIATGLAKAAALGTSGIEVWVCAGNYAETSLVLKTEVVLKGSYDCGAVPWTRSAGFGYPTFDGKNQTVVSNAAPAMQPATLVVTGSSVTSNTSIDGFAITGASTALSATYGVDIQTAAAPKLINDVVTGGGGKAPSGSWASVGVRIGGTSTAEITSSLVAGGSGEGAGGSVGVLIETTSAANVHEAVVTGGTGVSTGALPDLAAVGIAVMSSLDPAKPLRGLQVAGTDAAGAPGTSVGILVDGTVDAVIAGCNISGGSGTDTSTASVGVDLETTGKVSILDDRIFGGSRSAASAQTYGIRGGNVGTLTVADSEIHAGEPGGAAGTSAFGIGLSAGTSVTIAEDTIYTGATSNAQAISLTSNIKGAIVTGDILIGGGAASSDIGIVAGACTNIFATLDRTAFLGLPLVYSCAGSTFATDPGTMATDLTSSVKTDGNLELQVACPGSLPWCVQDPACPSTPPTQCVQSVLGTSWTSMDDGVMGLFDGPAAPDGGTTPGAWELRAGVSCSVARGGTVIAAMPDDLLGAPRGNMPSMGAVQYNASVVCQ